MYRITIGINGSDPIIDMDLPPNMSSYIIPSNVAFSNSEYTINVSSISNNHPPSIGNTTISKHCYVYIYACIYILYHVLPLA